MKKRGLMARKKRKSTQSDGDVAEVPDTALVIEDEECSDFELVLDFDPNGLLVVEGDSRQVLWANHSAEKMLRKKKEKLLSEPFPEELEEGPMRTFDLNKKVHSLTWQGQPAVLLTLTPIGTGGASFSLEWRLEAAEERAREADEQVQQLQAQLSQARKGSNEGPSLQSLKDHEAELQAELKACTQRLQAVEQEVRQVESRAERAEERAREAESLMEEAECQSRETERHLEDLSDSVRLVEEQLEGSEQALQEERKRAQRLQAELEEARGAGADDARLHTENESLREQTQLLQQEIDDLLQRVGDSEDMALEASGQVGEKDQELATLRGELKAWLEKQSQWQQRESEMEDLEGVHLQVITELEQLREERQTWQEKKDTQVVQPGELEESQERLREVQERLDFLEIERSELEEKWVESCAELDLLQEKSKAREQSQENALAELRQQLQQREQELHEAGLVAAQLSSSQAEIAELQLEMGAAQELVDELEAELKSSQQKVLSLTQGQHGESERFHELERQLAEVQLESAHLAEKKAELQLSRDSLQEQLLEMQALLEDEFRTQKDAQQQSAQNWEQEKAELVSQAQELEGDCALYQLRVSELETLLLESEEKARGPLEELALSRQELEKLGQDSASFEQLRADFEDVQQHLLIVEKERDKLLLRLDQAEESQRAVLLEEKAVQSKLDAKTAEAEDQATALADLEAELNRLQDALDAAPSQDDAAALDALAIEAEAARAENLRLQQQVGELQTQVADVNGYSSSLQQQIDDLEAQLEESALQEQELLRLRSVEAAEAAELSDLRQRLQELESAVPAVVATEDPRVAELESLLEQASQLEPELARLRAKEQAHEDEVLSLRQLLEEAQAVAPLPMVVSIPQEDPRISELESLLEQASQLEPEVARLRAAEQAHEDELTSLRQRLQEAQAVAPMPMVSSIPQEDPRIFELESLLEQASQLEPEVARLRLLESSQARELATLRQSLEELQSRPAQAVAVSPMGGDGNKATETLAFEDSLTKLPNFNLLQRYLDFSLKQVDRYQRKCALVHVDLDRFQALNEALGTEAGDEVLRQVAARLQKVVRTSDVLCRKSEDDFLILLSEVAGEADAPESISIVLRRIQEVMAPPIQAANQPILISVSIGVSQFPSDADDGNKMLIHAQSAMRRAKELGRNQIQFYTEELQKRHEARATLEAELRKGLEGRQFQLLYQPIVHLPTGAIKGVESLLRWAHPSYGVLTPDYFIEVADETGILVPLGRWVILQAAQQLYEWSRQGLDLFVTVNLSTRQFLQADLVDTIRRALESTGAPAHNFVVEVPESVQMLDIQRVQGILLALRQAGVRVALDRFGSGFSSLERLHSELITLLKVDRKFLFHAATNASALNVTVAALSLARALKLRPVAVGVENATQLSLCRQLECEYVQGNLVYVPTDAAQVGELARAGRLLR